MVTLFGGPEKTGSFSGTLAQGGFTPTDLKGITYGDLVERMRQGTVYVNVHTKVCTAGEIRGQIRK